ncbi:hypothetical protein N431DRAFT_455766 [Stipitochalara longipes BDJ]|nr:hypothetical protein N431DRAFT_455766 [Stipitochalara longipes BDJ]
MHHYKLGPATQPNLSTAQPTVRRVKGSRNLWSAISDFQEMTFSEGVPEPPPQIISAVPEPLRIDRTQSCITPMVQLSDFQEMELSEEGLEPLRIQKLESKVQSSVPQPLEIRNSRPPITSTADAVQAGKHTLEVALKPTPRRRMRRAATEKAPRRSSSQSEQKANPLPSHERSNLLPALANSNIPPSPESTQSLVPPNTPSRTHLRPPALDLGGLAIPFLPRSRQNAWKKSYIFTSQRNRSLLRNLSKRLLLVQETPLPSNPPAFAHPHERDLVLEKNAVLQAENAALRRENDALKRRREVLERACDRAKSDAVREMERRVQCQELLEEERGKVKLLQLQLESLAQSQLVSNAVSGNEDCASPEVFTAGKPPVSTDFAMQSALDPDLDNYNSGIETPAEAIPLGMGKHPNSFSERSKRHRRQVFPPTSHSRKSTGDEKFPIHELSATPIHNSPLNQIERNNSASKLNFAQEMEIQFQLPEVPRLSTGLGELVSRIDGDLARIRSEGQSKIELEGRSSCVSSEMGEREDIMRLASGTRGSHCDLRVPEEEYFRF